MKKMLLLKDGVEYVPYEYASEEELTQMVIEHHKEIFGEAAIYFDPQTMKTQTGTEARNDGIILTMNQNRWYIVEVELAKHPLHDHIIPQITKFSTAYEEARTRKKIIETIYAAIRQDPLKTATLQTLKIEDLHKTLTDLIDTQPTIAVVIDQKTPELDHICKRLPFSACTTEFRTYVRKGVGIGVHTHEFEPFFKEEMAKKPPIVRPIPPSGEIPQRLAQVLDVAEMVFRGQSLNEAFKSVAKQYEVHESTIRDKCTRQLNITTDQFRDLIKDKSSFMTLLNERYPQFGELIRDKLTQIHDT